ncbi:uncharacterized protein LOC115221992 [Octopus sinensis]|uniref:Uncharacterized protein LOC115221992 n=1 Tax=Octopus sinensis TaxID=2607531 RepID=A0A6P7TAJ0_9MOLL|nr:uncharacterized protein LOC115221992 [Octopus sinensis]
MLRTNLNEIHAVEYEYHLHLFQRLSYHPLLYNPISQRKPNSISHSVYIIRKLSVPVIQTLSNILSSVTAERRYLLQRSSLHTCEFQIQPKKEGEEFSLNLCLTKI